MEIILSAVARYNAGISIGLAVMGGLILGWVIFLQLKYTGLKNRFNGLFSDSSMKNLEDVVGFQAKSLKLLDKDIQELYNISNQIHNLSHRGLHKVGFLRFNPFKDVGGDQSFAIALLNGKNNGIVISALYTREGTRVYSKMIAEGKAEKYPLTEEEEQAIKMALASEPKKIN